MIGLPRRRSRQVVPHRTPGELDAMAAAGAVVAAALAAVRAAAAVGVSTLELDRIADFGLPHRDATGAKKQTKAI